MKAMGAVHSRMHCWWNYLRNYGWNACLLHLASLLLHSTSTGTYKDNTAVAYIIYSTQKVPGDKRRGGI